MGARSQYCNVCHATERAKTVYSQWISTIATISVIAATISSSFSALFSIHISGSLEKADQRRTVSPLLRPAATHAWENMPASTWGRCLVKRRTANIFSKRSMLDAILGTDRSPLFGLRNNGKEAACRVCDGDPAVHFRTAKCDRRSLNMFKRSRRQNRAARIGDGRQNLCQCEVTKC